MQAQSSCSVVGVEQWVKGLHDYISRIKLSPFAKIKPFLYHVIVGLGEPSAGHGTLRASSPTTANNCGVDFLNIFGAAGKHCDISLIK